MHPQTDIGNEIKTYIANASQTSGAVPILTVAAATEDNVKVTGLTIDTAGASLGAATASSDGVKFESGQLAVCGYSTLGSSETLKIAAELQESADNSTWDTAEVVYATTTVKTGTTTGAPWCKRTAINLRGRKRYIRFNITPDHSAGSTDKSLWVATFTVGGNVQQPTVLTSVSDL